MRLGLGLKNMRQTGAAFSPLSLSPSAWYDPSDLSSMYQTGTRGAPGAAAAVNSPVGLLLDKSGNNFDAAQATAASRPTLRQSGALYYLEFDGVDDFMAATFTVTHPADRVSSVRQIATTVNSAIYADPFNAVVMSLIQGGVDNLGLQSSLAYDPAVSFPVGSDFVVTERWTAAGPSSTLQKNQVAAVSGNPGTGVPTGMLIGSRFAGGANFANFR